LTPMAGTLTDDNHWPMTIRRQSDDWCVYRKRMTGNNSVIL